MLTFDATLHQYAWHGRKVYSVTRVLRRLIDFSGIDPAVLEKARERGKAVHRAIELDIAGDLDDESLHPEVRERFLGWRNFVKLSGFKVISSEQRVYSERHGYAGTIDLCGTIRRETYLPDIKATALVPPTVGLQTAAYAQALRETIKCGPVRRGVLHLKAGGKWQFLPLTRALDLTDFLSELDLLRSATP